MTRPLRNEFAGASYHVTLWGNGRKAIYLNAADYQRFVTQLQAALRSDEACRKEVEASMLGPRPAATRAVACAARPVTLSRMEVAVLQVLGGKREDLQAHGNRGGVAKSVALELACRKLGYSQVEAGRRYGGITCAAVGQQRRRLMQRLRQEPVLTEQLKQIERIFNI